MSTSARHLVASPAPVERRFYRRVVPSSLIYIALGGRASKATGNSPSSVPANSAMLLNLSENGLLVSTPQGITRNFVYRASIPLNGLATAIKVYVRVVWTNESRRAGMQMLDLSEHDREQIRKWAEFESRPDARSEQLAAPVSQRPWQKSRPMPMASAVESPKKRPSADSITSSRPVPTRSRAAAAKVVLAISAALLAAGLGIAMFFGDRPLRKSFVAKHTFLSSIFNSAGVEENIPSSARNIANTSNQPEADQVALPIVPSEPVSASSTPYSGATKEAAGLSDSHSVSNIITVRRSQAKVSPRKVDWQSASNQPIHVLELENLYEVAPPMDLLENAPSGIDSLSLPAMSVALAPPPIPARAPRIAGGPEPAVVSRDTPESRVLDLTPAKSHAGVLSVPGERVFQSTFVTTHVQRSILMPAAHWSSPFSRNRKVVVGELLSRVDPQPPHSPVRPGSRVVVRAIVDKNGRIETVKPVSGPITLIPNVARAVREWRYQPTFLDGKPVETEACVLFEFLVSPSPQPQQLTSP